MDPRSVHQHELCISCKASPRRGSSCIRSQVQGANPLPTGASRTPRVHPLRRAAARYFSRSLRGGTATHGHSNAFAFRVVGRSDSGPCYNSTLKRYHYPLLATCAARETGRLPHGVAGIADDLQSASLSLLTFHSAGPRLLLMPYFVRLSCRDCTGEDPRGCFDGGTEMLEDEHSEQRIFADVASAREAGRAEMRTCPVWEYEVVDEDGDVVEETP